MAGAGTFKVSSVTCQVPGWGGQKDGLRRGTLLVILGQLSVRVSSSRDLFSRAARLPGESDARLSQGLDSEHDLCHMLWVKHSDSRREDLESSHKGVKTGGLGSLRVSFRGQLFHTDFNFHTDLYSSGLQSLTQNP